MEGTIGDPDNHINHGESRHHAVVGTFEDTFSRGLDEFFGNRSTHGFVDDLNAFALFSRLHLNADVTILALTTGLADEFPFAVRGSLDGFAVGDLWLSSSRLNLELALHAVADDVQMQLTHARENRLPSVLVRLDTESGILGDEALERSAHLFLVGLGVRLDRHRDNGLGKGRRLQTDVEVFVTQRIASDDIFNANDGTDVP